MTEDERQRLTHIKRNLERRALIYKFTRDFFKERGFLEVETPVLVPSVAPEEYIVPFESEGWFLSTSPELYMKRLLAAGYDKLFQISRCFRKRERGRLHNPEFAMLEWYRTPGDYSSVLSDTEGLITTVAARLGCGSKIRYQACDIDITPPWPRISVRDAFIQAAGWDPLSNPNPERFDIDLCDKVMPGFETGRPTILMDYPAGMASMARLKLDNPAVAERAEVFIGGMELANAYTELNDYDEQKRRFLEDAAKITREQGRRVVVPDKFLKAVAHMPECGGIALGMDRLVMLLCDAASIDEVTPFTIDNV